MEQNLQGFRLSPHQEHLWALRVAEPTAPYVALCEVEISGGLDPARLAAALARVVERHEILRTSFRQVPGLVLPLQVIDGGAPVALPEELPATPWDPASGAPLRAALADLGGGRHSLRLALPALCADAATLSHLVAEIARGYFGGAGGGENEGPIQYVDIAEWHGSLLEAEESLDGKKHWHRLGFLDGLGGLDAALPFEPRAGRGFEPRALPLELDGGMAARIDALARQAGVSPATVLLGAWHVLLRRLTARTDLRTDLVVGLAVDGRKFEEMREALGPCGRHLPLLCEAVDDEPFTRLVTRLGEAQAWVGEWQEYFDWREVPGAAGAPRSFPFCFEAGEAAGPWSGGGVTFSIVRRRAFAEPFLLRLSVVRRQGAVDAEVQYDAGALAPEHAERLAGWYRTLLREALAHPERPVGDLELLSGDERAATLVRWNDTAADFGPPAPLTELVWAQAERSPERIAVVGDGGEGGEVSYAELRRRARLLAAYLRRLGVGPETPVALAVERSPEMVIGLLGILEAGGAWVPMDPDYPADRLRWVREDSGARVLLTQERLVARLPAGTGEVVCLDRDWPRIEAMGAVPDGGGARPEGLAYVIYTSGSTGRPKGVMIEHRAIANRLLWIQSAFPLSGDRLTGDRLLQKTPYSFDASIWEIFVPLLAGACVVLAEPGGQRDNAYLLDAVARQGVTTLQLVPSQLRLFLEQDGLRAGCVSLRRMFCGGEALPSALAARLFERLPDGAVGLCNLYGPTEAAIDATFHPCDHLPEQETVPLGRPIANVQVYLLDARWQAVPPGLPGELCIGGAGLARGYRGRPDLTAERFVPHPESAAPGARLYRTGDLARHLSHLDEGVIEFLGRIDHQVKVRGFRIEPGEIEAALARHAGILEAVVVAREDRLVAYVAPRGPEKDDSPDLSPQALRAFLAESLPDPMLPSDFVVLAALPRLPSGKLDRRSLPEPERTRKTAGLTAPRNATEEILAGVWAELLGLEQVGVEDDFFAVGGHSLLATQVVSRARELFGAEVKVRDLFEAPTVARFAMTVEALQREGQGLDAPPVRPVPRLAGEDGDLPLSFPQQRLWFLDRLAPGGIAYNLPLATRLAGPLDVRVLERALQEVVRRHEVLRTTIVEKRGVPVQVIAPEPRLPLPVIDLTALPDAGGEAEALLLAAGQVRRPFDLATGPLIRWALLRLDSQEHMREHVLLATAHHIVSDGWSMGILAGELGALYGAFARGEASPLPPLPVQYADFAVWQRRWLTGEVLERELAYWRRQLAGAPHALELPLDRPRPAVRSGAGGTIPVVIPAAQAAALVELSRREGVTLFMTLVSAFQALLGRWAGQDDVLVGTPVAGRNRREIEGLIGFFVNTLVLRADLAGSPPFQRLLARARTAALDAFAHQGLPFERLVEELGSGERDLSRSPLFQVMFAFQNVPQAEATIPGLALSPFPFSPDVAKFELTLTLLESEAGLLGTLEYDADLFDRSTAARLLAHLGRFLTEVAADPTRRVGEVPLLAAAERHQLLVEWNDARAAQAGPLCLHELVAARAERAPDAVAVTCEGAHLTYGALESRARRLARHLRRLGVGPEVPVALCLERSIDLVTALLGVWQAGGAYVPLDPSHPDERLAFLLADALAGAEHPVLLTQESLAGRFAGTPARILRLDAEEESTRAESASPLPALPSAMVPEGLAYVIYTSGSTGRPKGVPVTHANAARLFAATQDWFGFGPEDVWSVFHSYAFDFSVWELWGALVSGGRAVIVPYWISRSPEAFHRLLAEEGVTVLDQTPSSFRQLVATDAEANSPLALRLVIFGGEALDLVPLEPWFRRHGDERPRLVNMYGITETTVHVTYRQLSEADLALAPRSPIGIAIPDLTVHLLAARPGHGAEPVPVGVVGEIHVGGAGLARGYLGRPELTAERFVPDPFAAWKGEPGARLYRSGDLARRLADGSLEFLGRLDNQVKIRGFRIELGEVEAALAASPHVRDAVVLARPDRLGQLGLTAFVVPAAAGGADLDALRTHLRKRLPEHMVPADLVLLDALPLTANGKLDRKALLGLERGPAGPATAVAFVAPRTPVEAVVAAVFAEVLRLDRIGAHDGFFDLGGHSLLATQVMSRLREAFAVEMPLRDLFEAPTVAALAARVERVRGTGEPLQAPPIGPVSRDGDLPLSFAQQRLWFLDRFEPGGAAYNVPLAIRLTGLLDVRALERALAEVVRRHEVLRTTFAERDGNPVQVIAAELPLPLPVIDLGPLPEREAEVLRLAVAQARQPFDLVTGPLLRWALLRLGAGEHVMLATAHHIVSDAWSMGVLAGELGALYRAFSGNEPSSWPVLPPLPIQYADFAAWQRSWLSGAVLEWELAYWHHRLAGAPRALELPLDRPRGPVRGHNGRSLPVQLSSSLAGALAELARREGVTLFMTLSSAFQALLGRWSGQDDVLVGTPVAGRGRRELEGLIGFFVNTLVLRADLAGAPSFRELLRRARATALDAFAHQDLPFERLVDAMVPERDLSRSPLFQVMFALQNVPFTGSDVPGLTLSPVPFDPGMAKFELTLVLREDPSGLAGTLQYDADLFDGSTAVLLLSHLTHLLEAFAADPGQRIDEVPLVVPAERQQLLADWAADQARRRAEGSPVLQGRQDPRSGPGGARPFVAPRTPVEAIVATVFAEVLRLERVGADDRFFDLGGHSLLATQVMSRLREAFRVELPVLDLFEAPVVSALAERVERAREAASRRAAPIVPVPRRRGEDGDLPLSFAQQRLWFLDRFEPGGVAYNVPLATRLTGALRPDVLERALAEVLRRHEVLRTTFADRRGDPVQVIAPELRVPLPVIDLAALPAGRRESESRRLTAEQARRPFDLAAGPLVRWALMRLGPGEHAMSATAHHIVSDGWSMGILVTELGALYKAFARGEAPSQPSQPSQPVLPPLPVQYADFAVWQRRWLAGEALERELAYWRHQLDGAPQALDLPLDRPRPAVRSGAGGTVPVALPPALAAALAELSRREGVTPFMTLLAAFQAVLGRWSGQEDLLVGTPVAGRDRREIEGLIGFFVNTLVLRADLAGAPAFRQLLARTRAAALDAFAHQTVPFERLVEELAPERDLGRSPLFQVMFAFQNVPLRALALPGLTLSELPVELDAAKFELMLTLGESAAGLGGTLQYDADLFDRSTAVRLLAHLGRFLEAVVADPDRRVAGVPLLAAAERQQVLEWNDTGEGYAAEMGLHELVEARVERSPDAVAVAFEDEELSYAELDRRSNRLAWRLRELGVGPEVPVAICVERSPAMVIGLLAVLKAGGAYVPLDPDYPAERLAYMIEDSGAPLLLTQSHLAPRLPVDGARVLLLDGEAAFLNTGPEERLPVAAMPDSLLYVIYTSGSTGRPKGVMVRHRGVVNRLLWADRAYPVTSLDRVLQKAPFSFDFSVWECFGPLLAGARLVLARPGGQRDGRYLARTVVEQGITLLHFVPAMLQAFLEEEGLEGCRSLRYVFSGGDVLTAEVRDRFRDRLPEGVLLRNQYGPTEISIDVTEWICRPGDGASEERRQPRQPPIGRPIGNGQAYVLDAELEPVPVGVAGELLLGGEGVARGYRGRPDLTAERFIPNPWANAWNGAAGTRLYRTGDRARLRPDGVLEFLGRVDQQLKVRGYRIEPGEIEAVLLGHPGVREAAVVARQDGFALLASVVPADGQALEAEELRAFARERLPEYMVPAGFLVLEALPLTPSGKVDRPALRRLEPGAASGAAAAGTYLAPRTPAEEIVAAIFGEVLRHDRVGVRDGFFDLGGHSLLATQVVSRVREAFAVDLPLRDLFEAPTVAALAERIEQARNAGGALQAPPIVPVPRSEDLPLSFSQQRLWFLERLAPGGAAYNVPLTTRLSGPLDAPALERALSEVVRRHEVLRTTFAEWDGKPVQVIAPASRVPLPRIDLEALPERTREAETVRLAMRQARQPFDLASGPLVRWVLLRLAADEHVILAAAHHIVSDAWSMGILVGELGALYAAFSRGEASPLPALPVQYADFAVWQRRWLEGEVLEHELAYWRDRLAGAPQALELPLDRPRPAVRSGAGGTIPVVIPAALAAALTELSRREGATLFMTLASAFQALLGRWAGQDDVLIGTPVAGRDRREVEGLIGFFVNTLVLRAELSGSPPFRELLRRARATTLDAFAHQALPFERLVEAVAPQRDLTRSPLFQVMFAFQNVPQGGAAIPGLALSPLPVDLEVAKFELMLTLGESPAGLAGTLEYDADLFDRSTVARLLSHLGRFLEAVAADPGRRTGDVPLLAAAERHQLLVEWNDSAEGYAGGLCLHELVEARVDRTPDAVAVSLDGEELSYAELERRSNRLAWRLRELGVGPEVPVAMCVERSLPMVVGLLAVLKAGGAYVPLDPDYPAERLAIMIEDSGAALLLAQSHLVLRLPAGNTRVLLLDDESGLLAAGREERLPAAAMPDSLLYVIYTSGSTGRPKGVMVRHQGVVNRLLWADRAYPVTAADRVLQKAPFSFDFSVWECFGPLLAGARLVLARPGGQRDGRYLARTVVEQGITLLHFVPAMLQVFLEEEGLASCRSLRFVFSGGDALSSEVRDRFRARLPAGVLLRNQYGPTEISIDMTEWICGPGDDTGEGRRQPRQPPIGRPIGNGRAFVVDAEWAPVPVGVAGELLLGGEGVARGYRGRADLTAERFIPSAWDGGFGARVYRTGDRARWRPDGALEFLGRVDQQVKIRGYRIEPGEIESVLLAHPAVREVGVVVRAVRDTGDRQLVACVVPDGEAAPAPDALRSFVRERLPEYMVPAGFLVLEALPLTPSGKVDRRALAALELSREREARALVPPRTPVEEALVAIWRELLGVEEIGVEDSFFDLGGHSLLATSLFSRVQHAFGVDLSLRQIFHAPTIAALAQAVEEQLPPPEPTENDVDRLLDQLETLSDEEVMARLAELESQGLDG